MLLALALGAALLAVDAVTVLERLHDPRLIRSEALQDVGVPLLLGLALPLGSERKSRGLLVGGLLLTPFYGARLSNYNGFFVGGFQGLALFAALAESVGQGLDPERREVG